MIGNELMELAMEIAGSEPEGEREDFATRLAKLAQRVQALENIAGGLGLEDEDVFPTPSQSLALGRFLGRAMRDEFLDDNAKRIRMAATVSRGGFGLGEDYLFVRMADGYEGGIDREGRVST